jgi:hypothetical protein
MDGRLTPRSGSEKIDSLRLELGRQPPDDLGQDRVLDRGSDSYHFLITDLASKPASPGARKRF